MSIVFYEAPMSSATPVACALAELEVPHEKVPIDLSSGEQRKPEFLKLNPNGKVPTLVVDGTPMFEALAILIWLGERYGVQRRLWPEIQSERHCQALAWSVWAYVSYGSALSRRFLATGERFGGDPKSAQAVFTHDDLESLQATLDGELGKRAYLLGDAFTLVDLIVAAVVGFGAFSGVPVSHRPHAQDWLTRCQGRPSFRSVMGG
ncbi:MAG TPA: glutathione S-transferase family protein [Polyangiaceae bacterium]|nr:glutathione S-transferase family protein [Polyangiaceae bacterium]